MATKKGIEEEIREEVIEEKDPNEELVDVFIPIDRNRPGDVTVWVNDRSWTIRRGVRVKIPLCAALQLQHAEKMESDALEYSIAQQNAAADHARSL
ncbi:MAG: hypothetical protein IKP68_06135 [Clostridia bacterium]|nr:hypothetical protein [Clostridia bacterium]